MKFINVSELAEEMRAPIDVVFKKVQQKLFDKGFMWAGTGDKLLVSCSQGSIKHYHHNMGGIVVCIENDDKLTFFSVEYAEEKVEDYHSGNIIQINFTDFEFVFPDKTVKLEGEYTKEQLQEILNNMKE